MGKKTNKETIKKVSANAKGSRNLAYKDVLGAFKALKSESLTLNATIRNLSAMLDGEPEESVKLVCKHFGITANLDRDTLKSVRVKIIAELPFVGIVDGKKIPVRLTNNKDEAGVTESVTFKPSTWVSGIRAAVNRWAKGLQPQSIAVATDKPIAFNLYKALIEGKRSDADRAQAAKVLAESKRD